MNPYISVQIFIPSIFFFAQNNVLCFYTVNEKASCEIIRIRNVQINVKMQEEKL
jgi:hypothetical protein